MTSLSHSIRFAGALVALVAGTLGVAGCASDCGSNCPVVSFQVAATFGENLSVQDATWTGDACPTDQVPECRGNFDGSLPCVLFSVIGVRPGTCRLDLTFTDGRAPFSATATFGSATTQGCCQGFPVEGAPLVYVPSLHPPAVVDAGTDGGSDAGTSDAVSD